MHILHINLSNSFGGGPEHLYQLLRETVKNSELRCFVATPLNSPYTQRYRELVGEAQLLNMPGRRFTIKALLNLVFFARKNKINILHSHGKGAGLYGRIASLLTGIKCVHTFHGLHMNYSLLLKNMYILLERALGKCTAAAISVSSGEFMAISEKKLASRGRLHLICNGVVVPEKFSPRSQQDFSKFRVLHFSRFDVAKNSELILDIALALRCQNSLEDIEFVILGNGAGCEAMKKRVLLEGLENHITFAGFTSNPLLFLKESNCYLSTSRWEGMPLSVLEAMAEGLPVIASDVVGNRDAVLDLKTGFLFPLSRPHKAAAYILKLQGQPSLCEKMGRLAHQRVQEKFTVAKMAASTVKLYKQVMELS